MIGSYLGNADSWSYINLGRKLAEDCCKYGADAQNTNAYVARAVLQFGTSRDLMENERETLLGILGDQVNCPLCFWFCVWVNKWFKLVVMIMAEIKCSLFLGWKERN